MGNLIFNKEKSDYGKTESLFLGERPGLGDTVHRGHDFIWKRIYKTMKDLVWDEDEFDFGLCAVEFTTRPKRISTIMRRTLLWQWGADSVASRTILPVMAPFINNFALQCAWTEITSNECVHTATYSEIVRSCFKDPEQVMAEVTQDAEVQERMRTVIEVMEACYRRSHLYAIGEVEDDQETYNAAFLMTAALYVMERLQFMASFAVTFAIGEMGAFMSIAKAVQRICQDEFEVHAELDRYVLEHEMKTDRGKIAIEQCWPRIKAMIDEVVEVETKWNQELLGDEPLPGLNAEGLSEWGRFCAASVYKTFGRRPDFPFPKQNPLKYMENWISMSKVQSAKKEQLDGQYKSNIITKHGEQDIYDVRF